MIGLSEASAAYLSYAILVPVSFIGHRRLTFQSSGAISGEWLRFCVVQMTNIALIWIVTSAAASFTFLSGWPAFAIISILIPILNFIVFQIWVFAKSL